MTTINYGDKIKLVNQYTSGTAVPNAGYLDSYGNLGILGGAQAYGVQTSAKPNRDGGSGTWQVVPSSKSEITVTADQDATFLSCSPEGEVDLWSHNDRSGRQTWYFRKTEEKGDVYNILVSGGTNQGEAFLSSHENGKVDLWSHDDGSGRQKWELIVIEAGPSGDVAYNIKVFGGTGFGEAFLSCTPEGRVDLWKNDDDSGRQKWRISNFHEWGLTPKIVITSIDWAQIGSLPAGRTTAKEIVVGVTQMDSKTVTTGKTFNASFEVSASYTFSIGATAEAKASTSLELSHIVETMKSTTMTYQETITQTWEVSDKNRAVWGLTMQGVLLAHSLCGF